MNDLCLRLLWEVSSSINVLLSQKGIFVYLANIVHHTASSKSVQHYYVHIIALGKHLH